MTRFSTRAAAAGLALALASGIGATAQTGVTKLGLSNDDYRIMREANQALYVEQEPVVGAETIWQNPESGTFGSTEITGWDGRCVDMTILVRVGGARENARFDWRVCRQDDGRWLNAPSPE